MAGGASYLLFYVSCFGFVALAIIVAVGLYAWGRRVERRTREAHLRHLEREGRPLDPTSPDG